MKYRISYQVDSEPHVKIHVKADSDLNAITRATKIITKTYHKRFNDPCSAPIKIMSVLVYALYYVTPKDGGFAPQVEEREIFYGGYKAA